MVMMMPAAMQAVTTAAAISERLLPRRNDFISPFLLGRQSHTKTNDDARSTRPAISMLRTS